MDNWIGPAVALAVALVIGMLGVGLALRRRRAPKPASRKPKESLDTVAAWPPQAARVLSKGELLARQRLLEALPGVLVLAHVPVSRFIRVPTRHSYAEWLHRIGYTCVDLLVCDAQGRPIAAVEIRRPETIHDERRQVRRERLSRVLEAAGLTAQFWREDALPEVTVIRSLLAAAEAQAARPEAIPRRGMHPAFLDEGLDVASIPFEESGIPEHQLANSTWFDELTVFDDTMPAEDPTLRTAVPERTPSR